MLTKQVDVADSAALAQALSELRSSGSPLRGIIHAAMVLDDSLLINVSAERISNVMGPKVRGALHLDGV